RFTDDPNLLTVVVLVGHLVVGSIAGRLIPAAQFDPASMPSPQLIADHPFGMPGNLFGIGTDPPLMKLQGTGITLLVVIPHGPPFGLRKLDSIILTLAIVMVPGPAQLLGIDLRRPLRLGLRRRGGHYLCATPKKTGKYRD